MTYHIRPANYASGTLTSPVGTGDTTITFAVDTPGFSFPTLSATSTRGQQYLYLTLVDALTLGSVTREIVTVQGPASATTGSITYTVIRAQQGTSAHAFAVGDLVQLRLTEQTLFDIGAQGAPDGWFNVADFSFDDLSLGVVDATQAIQAAIDAAFASHGGIVYMKAGNYLCSGQLTLKDNVQLQGQGGPTGAWGAAGGLTVRAVTISITNSTNTFIKNSGRGTSVTNLIFYHPNQQLPTAVSPTAYPYVITDNVGDCRLENLTFVNPTHGISLNNGPCYLRNLRIGAFNVGISMDQGGAAQTVENVQIGCGLLDAWLGYSFPQNLDLYTYANCIAIDIRRSDDFRIDNLVTFFTKIGIQMVDSVVASGSLSSYGDIVNCDLEAPQYGIVCQSSNSGLAAGGVRVTNVNILGTPQPGPFGQSTNAIWMKSGGATPPFMSVMNGFIGNTWSGALVEYDAGTLITKQLYNVDYPAANVTAPSVPASTVTATNTYPYTVAVYITGGTYTAVSVNAGATLGTPTVVMLPANATIAITYSVAPTWVWAKGV